MYKYFSIIFIGLLSIAEAFAQPRAVVKVNFAIQGDAGHVEKLDGALRSELQRRRDVVVTTRRPDYAVDVVVAPVIVDNEVVAFVAAILITRKSGGDFLAVAVEADLQALAKQVAARLNDDSLFQLRRRRDW